MSALFACIVVIANALTASRFVEWGGVTVARRLVTACEVLVLLTGALSAWRSARVFDDALARRAWRLAAIWLGTWTIGQTLFLGYYLFTAKNLPPVPSAADAFFVVGYGAAFGAVVSFVVSFIRSGFPFGTARAHAAAAAVASAIIVVLFVKILPATITDGMPWAEQAITLAYPIGDGLLFVPTLILLRMALHLRGGGLWRVWASMLLGIVVFCAGDIVFSLLASTPYEPVIDLLFLNGYSLVAWGALSQHRLSRG